jgi:hypothetical protein
LNLKKYEDRRGIVTNIGCHIRETVKYGRKEVRR